MATALYNDTPIDPQSLNGVNHLDISLVGKRLVQVQFDPLTSDADGSSLLRLYFRLDQETAAGGTTVALLKPQGFLCSGDAVEFWIDPDDSETPTLHLLLTDDAGTATTGSTLDNVLVLPFRTSPD